MMSANVGGMVREGISAIKAGRKDEARALLVKATELDPYNEDAWLWLSGIVEDPEDQRTCLENVLSINPGNQRASQGLAYLNGGTMPTVGTSSLSSPPAVSAPPPAAPAYQPPPPPAYAPPPQPVISSFPVEASASTATSVEWDLGEDEVADERAEASYGGIMLETSSASASRRVAEPSAQEYQDWVNNLGISGNAPSASPAPGSAAANTPFGDFSLTDDDVAKLERASFDAGSPFTAKQAQDAAPLPPPRKRRAEAKPVPAAEPEPVIEVDELVQGDLFAPMPRSIVATRLPGTRERVSPLIRVASFLLIVANLVAATWLIYRLTA